MSESIAHVWAELETVLGGCLSDGERDVWMNDALAYSNGKMAFDTLVEKIRDVRTFYGAKPHRPQRAGKMHHPPSIMEGASKENGGSELTRTEVLAEFIVVHATQDPAVRQFREEVLQGKLLPWSEIQGWVTQQRQRETEQELSRAFLKVPLPPNHHFHLEPYGVVPDPPLYVGEAHPAQSIHFESLAYAIPESEWVHRMPVAYGGILARLHQLSTELAERYRWEPAQATVFILTGLVPVLETLGTTWRWSTFQMPNGRVTALSHLVLIIDPTLTPQEVSTKFQRMRQRILGAKWRDLKDRQLALARFALHCVEEELWPQRMEAWNNDFEQWRYTNVSNFKRDCLNAIQKLLDPISPDVFENLFPHSEESHAETPRQS